MSELVNLERLPEWVRAASCSRATGSAGTTSGSGATATRAVPAMRDYMLVSYRAGATPMRRRFDGRWRKETLGPGATSLFTRAQRAHWGWQEAIDVTHLYLARL